MERGPVTYSVKEIFYTLQGEGVHAGRPAVFCRFSGCNLWSGLERDRSSAICQFCDTDFVGTDGINGGKFRTPAELVDTIKQMRPEGAPNKCIVCTGGEPLLQLDPPLIQALSDAEFEIAVETNGTIAAPAGIDWICVSPKSGSELLQTSGNELKLVYPQNGAPPDLFVGLDFDHFLLQPMDSPEIAANTEAAISYCKADPRWKLSVQSHKSLGIP